MSPRPAERIPAERRLRSREEFARLRAEGRAIRGSHCLMVVELGAGEPTKVGFVASRKAVGGAVQRNRARRRLREIVRRRWPRIAPQGFRMLFVAFRTTLTAPHAELARDVERLLGEAGAFPGGEG